MAQMRMYGKVKVSIKVICEGHWNFTLHCIIIMLVLSMLKNIDVDAFARFFCIDLQSVRNWFLSKVE